MSADDEITALKARIAALEAENDKLKEGQPQLCHRVSIKKILNSPQDYFGRVVGVGGWVRSFRKGGGGSFMFVDLYDGSQSTALQCIVDADVDGFMDVKQGCQGACVWVVGIIHPSKGRGQVCDLVASSVKLLGGCDALEYPLAGKNLKLEFIRSIGHLRARNATIGAISRVRNALAFAVHKFFQQQDYLYVHTPLITCSDCEGGGEMFQVTTLLDEHTDKPKPDAVLPDGKLDYKQDFFGKKAFLTVSGQLNGEIYATALSSIYTFGPTFRAENSHTTRHLAEFWMIEPEIAFADIEENMDIAEAFVKFVIGEALRTCPDDMEALEKYEQKNWKVQKAEAKAQAKARQREENAKRKAEAAARKKAAEEAKAQAAEVEAAGTTPDSSENQAKKDNKKGQKKDKKKDKKKALKAWKDTPLRERLQQVISAPFARVTYTEAIEILLKAEEDGHEFSPDADEIKWGLDMHSSHERYLCEVHFGRPTIVIDYPKHIKAFYMRMNDDGKTVRAMDVLVPGVGELIGGSQREERYDELKTRIEELDLGVENYKWYLDLRKFGSVPHSGFGAGFGRLVCYTTGIDHIRDCIPFPRYPGHAEY